MWTPEKEEEEFRENWEKKVRSKRPGKEGDANSNRERAEEERSKGKGRWT